jgi:D-alanine-D-alanine ligase
MRIGLSYDLKEAIPIKQNEPEDAFEEYDPPETVEIIVSALEAKGHTVIKLGGGLEFVDNVRCSKVDIVFNIAEGRGTHRSREAQVPSILEMLDIPYTGSDPQCLSICLDKPLVKKLLASNGISTPQWLVIADEEELNQASWDEFSFPAIIKPAYEGSSKGIRLDSIAYNPEQAIRTVQKLLTYYRQPVMAEEFITGDEITIGLMGNYPPKVLGMMRILPRKKGAPFIYSVEVKRDWKALVDYECPALIEGKMRDKLSDSSLKIFKSLGCRDFARVDFRVSQDGEPYFIEINPLPGLGTYSDLVIMAIKMGWTHETLISAILDSALERYPQFACV